MEDEGKRKENALDEKYWNRDTIASGHDDSELEKGWWDDVVNRFNCVTIPTTMTSVTLLAVINSFNRAISFLAISNSS